jgi:hypothetical protein
VPNIEASQHLDEPADVVFVRMGEQQHVDRAVPERHHLAEAAQRAVRIGTTVDEHLAA